jgi:hypothetical protein
MAQGEFTKEECNAANEALTEVMEAFPKSKALYFIGHFNDIFLFLSAVKKHIENEEKK